MNELIVYDSDKKFDVKHAATASLNPLTACAMLDISKKNGAKAIVILAASS